MLSTRRITSTWHGLVVDEVRRGMQRTVVITEVQAASPAEVAGFKAGDEPVRVGEMPVTCTLDLERGLLDSHPGKPTRLVVRRAGAESSLALDVRPLPRGMNLVSSEPSDMVWEILGLKTMAVSPDWVAAVSPKLRRIVHRGGLARQPGGRRGHREGGHPGGNERRHPPLGDDPTRQYPLRPSPARGRANSGCRPVPDSPQWNSTQTREPGGNAGQEG